MHEGKGGYVCMPVDRQAQDNDDLFGGAAPPPKTPSPPPSSSSSTSPSPPSSTTVPAARCQITRAGTTDVRVVTKSDAPTAIASRWPADGRYVLVQASAYPPDRGSSPIVTLRASVEIANARLYLGAEGSTGGGREENESFTLTLASGTLTKVCQTGSGPVGWAFLPGEVGTSTSSQLGWDEQTSLVTMLMTTPYATVELVFAKEL